MNQLKYSFLLFLSICSLHAQELMHSYPEEVFQLKHDFYLSQENINGPVKKVTVKNYSYTFNEVDSSYVEYAQSDLEKDVFVDFNTVFEFNNDKHLIRQYELENDTTLFLEEENTYNADGKHILRASRTNKTKKIDGKETPYIHLENEKRVYTAKGDLKEIWRKSSFQDAYFIDCKYTYIDEGLLSKYESFNDNILTSAYVTCKGSSPDSDFIKLYSYDAQKRVQEIKIYVFEYTSEEESRYEAISERDFSMYSLQATISYEYNKKNLVTTKKTRYFSGFEDNDEVTTTYAYDSKNRLVHEMQTYSAGHGYGQLFEYHEKDNELYKISRFNTKKSAGSRILSKTLDRITEKFEDRFKQEHFSDGETVFVEYFSKYGDKIRAQDLEYDNINTYQYTYDAYGNWTSRVAFENGIKTEKTVRTLEYFAK